MEKVVETVRQGLEKTGRVATWGLDWPWKPVSGVSLVGDRESTLRVAFELKNERGAIIGTTTADLPYSYHIPNKEGYYRKDGQRERLPENSRGTFVVRERTWATKGVTFTDVKAENISDKLSIAVSGIDGAAAERTAQSKHISIITESELDKASVYVVGSSGSGGGIVFYDKGTSSGGWRYLEASPAETEFTANWNDAVQRCRQMRLGGKADWRLPDEDELDSMYRNLKLNRLGGFSSGWYWSSSQATNNRVWIQSFGGGRQIDYAKAATYSVRAVRAF